MKAITLSQNIGWLSIALILIFTILAHAAPGDLDLAFGGTGKSRLGFGFGNDFGRAVAVQADGKLVVAGHVGGSDSNGDIAIVRYNTDNSLDTSFGVGGKTVTVIEPGSAGIAALRTQGDGKIVVAGYFFDGTNSDFLVARYNADGSLDTSFDADGMVTTDIGTNDTGNAMIIGADGKIIVTGYNSGGTALIRYNADGSLDTSFDADGKVTTPNGAGGYAVTLQSDGKIVVAGQGYVNSSLGFKVARYNTNGTLDTSFGSGGQVGTDITSGLDYASAVAIQPSFDFMTPDKIVVAGSSGFGATGLNSQFAVVRYNLNGTPDTSFDGDGIVTTDIGAGQDVATAVTIQQIGLTQTRIFVAGNTESSNYPNRDFAVIRYNLNGSLNTGFDADGIAVTSIGVNDDASAMRLQAGKIVVAGSTVTNETNSDFALARYDPVSGALDTAFDTDGKKTEDIADRNSSAAKSTAIQADGKIVVAGYAESSNSSRAFAVARYNTDGTLDASFGGDGKVATEFTGYSEGNAAAVQADGKIVVAGKGGSDFAVVRYNTDGTLDTSFSADGKATTDIGSNSFAKAVAIQTDGKIVVAGDSGTGSSIDFAVVRYLADGSLDSSFGTNGKAITGIGSQDNANAVKIQTDGKIVVAGSAVIAKTEIALVRYNSNGTLDQTFGSFGRVAADTGGSFGAGAGMTIQSDGKIVVTGTSVVNSIPELIVVRYLANGSFDTSFDADGIVITSIGVSVDVGLAIAITTSGKIIVAGYSAMGSDNEFTVVRYGSAGALDNSYGIGGKVVVDVGDGSDAAAAIALDSTGRAVVAGDAGGLFGVVRLQGDVPTAASVTVSGRVFASSGRGLANAVVSMTDAFGSVRVTRTSALGYYRFDAIQVGQTYIFDISGKRYQFEPQAIQVFEEMKELNFIGGGH